MIFQYWRALKKEAIFLDTQSFTGNLLPESYLYNHIVRIYDEFNYCPSWVYTWEFIHQPDILDALSDICMLCHFDRMYS